MKKIFFLLLALSVNFQIIYSQTGNLELVVHNETGCTLTLQLHPVSMMMNGLGYYNIVSRSRAHDDPFGTIVNKINLTGFLLY